MRSALLAALAGALVLVGTPRGGRGACGAAADEEASTAHVVVRGDLGAAKVREYAQLAEAAYPRWKAYFGAVPKKERLPLELDVRADRAGFLDAAHRAGVVGDLPGAGGYYDVRSRRSFLYAQPHESSTRILVLHEMTHQFQYKALQDDVPDRSPVWHREGLAEHFGQHRRTAAGLEMGALDMVTIDERPTRCAERVRAGRFDAWAIGSGAKKDVDYEEGLALVETFLRTKDQSLRAEYERWETDVYRSGNAASTFERRFGPKRARLEAAVKEVWGSFVAPWRVGYVAWDEEPGAIVGRGSPWAVLLGGPPLDASARRIEAEIDLDETTQGGGVGLGATDRERLLVADLRRDGLIVLRRRVNATWTEYGAAQIPGGRARARRLVRLEVVGSLATVTVGGVPMLSVALERYGVSPADLDGPAALVADTGEVRFRRVVVGRP